MLKMEMWSAEAEGETCVRVKIDTKISLEGATVKLINGERQVELQAKLESHDLKICSETSKPLYVEIHLPGCPPSVKYVERSGSSTYSKTSFSSSV
jgi:hypothetical protein